MASIAGVVIRKMLRNPKFFLGKLAVALGLLLAAAYLTTLVMWSQNENVNVTLRWVAVGLPFLVGLIWPSPMKSRL